MKVFILRECRTIFHISNWVVVKRKNEKFEYVINSKNYSSKKKLQDVKIFKFDLNNKFLERIDVERVEMINDKMWKLINGNRLELNQSPIEFKNSN